MQLRSIMFVRFMKRRLLAYLLATLCTALGVLVAAAPAHAASAERCTDIGNGLLCIRAYQYPWRDDQFGEVTVWYDKRSGSTVEVHLEYTGPHGIFEDDDGSFRISAGQVRGYIWSNRWTPPGCYTPRLVNHSTAGTPQLIRGFAACV
jgi:hypothetical protein